MVLDYSTSLMTSDTQEAPEATAAPAEGPACASRTPAFFLCGCSPVPAAALHLEPLLLALSLPWRSSKQLRPHTGAFTAPRSAGLLAAAAIMAEAPREPSTEGHLEQKILQVLGDAGCPVRIAQLVRQCQVPKKELNQVLYRMKGESKISLAAPATWCLGGDGAEDEGPAELPQPSREERIYRFLQEVGKPQRALHIAQALGKRTTREVNPDLHKMKSWHLLDFDERLRAWTIYQPGDAGRRNQPNPIIYQQNPVNMICQNGPNGHISISHSEATQIGHGNVMACVACGEDGPGDSTQGPPAGTWGTQDIHMERTLLRRVQLGHGNQMSLHGTPADSPAHDPAGSPPVSATTAGPEVSFEAHTPTMGPHADGHVAQRVHIKSCFLEDTAIGNSNRMTVDLEAADPRSEAPQPRSNVLGDSGQPDPGNIEAPTSQLEVLTLEKEPVTAERHGLVGGSPAAGSQRGTGV
ncbi:Z-DNA-binding protein 1 [Tupaia chinensis]|uniref:Z-DNA-binding protein 1 n=1 Tax=Tupaia chinensis TaxID=246437 RepID=L9L955_TUPCH|nr:Z-DNA-binding protein 1 [Tupaia chinensis]